MTKNEELKTELRKLSDKGFLKYLIKTGYCARDVWDDFIDTLDEEDAREELDFLNKLDFKSIYIEQL